MPRIDQLLLFLPLSAQGRCAGYVTVLRVGGAWLVGVGNGPLMGAGVFHWSLLMARRIDSKHYALLPYIGYKMTRHNRAARWHRVAQGSAGF